VWLNLNRCYEKILFIQPIEPVSAQSLVAEIRKVSFPVVQKERREKLRIEQQHEPDEQGAAND